MPSKKQRMETISVRVTVLLKEAGERIAARQGIKPGVVYRHWIDRGFSSDELGREVAAALSEGEDSEMKEHQVRELIQEVVKPLMKKMRRQDQINEALLKKLGVKLPAEDADAEDDKAPAGGK